MTVTTSLPKAKIIAFVPRAAKTAYEGAAMPATLEVLAVRAGALLEILRAKFT